MKKRLLRKDEIDVRVGGFNKEKTGGFLLLYKDARVDMDVLDEVYGKMNWQRTHEVINGNLFCNISVWDKEKEMWITKSDVGIPSQSDEVKGEASDSFKRAAFNWGIGTELYTAPFIWINGLSKFDKFKVTKIGYNDKNEIDELEIINIKTKKVVHQTWKTKTSEKIEKPTAKELQDLFILSGSNKELMQQALERLGMKSSKDITKDNLFKVEAIVKEMLEA